MTTPLIKSANEADQNQAIAAIALAFATDPVSRWIYPDPYQYLTCFPEVVRLFAGNAFKEGTCYCVEAFAGVALWLPPNVHPGDEEMQELLKQTVPEHHRENVFALLEKMGANHPNEPHWYLPMIGVDPSHQGKGYGSALMEHALAYCDQERKLAYLETGNKRNIPLYERYGYELLPTIRVGSAPEVFPMLREPRVRPHAD